MATTPTLTLRPTATPVAGAPAVVALHGMASSSAADFESTGLLAALHAAGRDVVLVDLPGHGRSAEASAEVPDAGAEGSSLSVASLLAQVADGVGALVAGPVDVLGFSLGARLAWSLPAAGLEVRRLALLGLAPQEPFGMLDLEALRSVVLDGAEAGDPFTGMMGGMLSQPEAGRADRLALVAALAAAPFDPTAAPAVPTLVAAGSEDPVAGSPEWAAGVLADGRTLVVPGDHAGSLRSAEFAAAALEFLG